MNASTTTTMLLVVSLLCLLIQISDGFLPSQNNNILVRPAFVKQRPDDVSQSWGQQQYQLTSLPSRNLSPLIFQQSNPFDGEKYVGRQRGKIWKNIIERLNTIKSSGFKDASESPSDGVRLAGSAGSPKTIIQRIKRIHDPITYLVLSLLAGFRWDWCFRNPYYWFGVGFCIKWYRAKYVFKIPVWDRQPNWNNIITSKEQEKDLKAFTCKNCGSTIFIAKTREFFFEGSTGIGGLGCFSCGAKGKDNFVMDRDRIVEDVGDMDDYFEYERPLDFVSRAERRALLKEAQGDEERANQLLLEKQKDQLEDTVQASTPSPTQQQKSEAIETSSTDVADDEETKEPSASSAEIKPDDEDKPKTSTPQKKSPPPPPPKSSGSDDDLDLLDMDA